MSFDDDAADDSAGFRPPPHPDDRLWRHPSELRTGRSTLPPRSTARSTPNHGPWGTLGVAASGVILIAAGVTVVSVGLSRDGAGNPSFPIESSRLESGGVLPLEQLPIGTQADAEDFAEIVEPLRSTLVRVDSGQTRGSGVVLRDEGFVITSDTVVGSFKEVTVSLSDGRLLTGELVGTDPVTGIAVIDLPGDGYATPTVPEGGPAEMVASAYAVGVGETSGLIVQEGELDTTPTGVDRTDRSRLDGVFALATPTDPLARGGPIVDRDATVLGITVWTDDTTSYVLPIDVAERIVDDIAGSGRVQHSWLGIDGHDAFANDGSPAGVFVASVLPHGPSHGVLQSGDMIVALGEQPVRGMPDLVLELRRHEPETEVSVTYRRGIPQSTAVGNLTLTVRPSDI